jgi:hypothetical protein
LGAAHKERSKALRLDNHNAPTALNHIPIVRIISRICNEFDFGGLPMQQDSIPFLDLLPRLIEERHSIRILTGDVIKAIVENKRHV